MFFRPKERHDAKAVFVVVLGTACFLSWGASYFLMRFAVQPDSSVRFAGCLTVGVSYFAMMVYAVLFFRSVPSLSEKPSLPFLALSVVGVVLGGYSHLVPQAELALAGVGDVFVGLEMGWLLLLWSDFFEYIDSRCVGFAYSLVFVVAAIIYYAIAAMPHGCRVFTLAGLPIASTLALVAGYRACKDDESVKNAHIRIARGLKEGPYLAWRTSGLYRLMAPAIVTVCVFGFAFAVFYGIVDRTGTEMAGLGVLGLVLFVTIALLSSHVTIKVTYRLAQPLMGLGILLMAFSEHLGMSVITYSYALILFLLILAICEAANRFETTVIRLTGFAFGANLLALIAGSSLGAFLKSIGAGEGVGMEVICAALLFCLMLYFALCPSNGGFIFEHSNSPEKRKGNDDPRNMERSSIVYNEAVNQRCGLIASDYGLTAREEEVLVLVMRGVSIQSAAEMLSIAPGTVKTHINHIYKKLGVTTRDEARALVGV